MSFDFENWTSEEDARAKLIMHEFDIFNDAIPRSVFDAPSFTPPQHTENRQSRRAKKSKFWKKNK